MWIFFWFLITACTWASKCWIQNVRLSAARLYRFNILNEKHPSFSSPTLKRFDILNEKHPSFSSPTLYRFDISNEKHPSCGKPYSLAFSTCWRPLYSVCWCPPNVRHSDIRKTSKKMTPAEIDGCYLLNVNYRPCRYLLMSAGRMVSLAGS